MRVPVRYLLVEFTTFPATRYGGPPSEISAGSKGRFAMLISHANRPAIGASVAMSLSHRRVNGLTPGLSLL